MLCARDIMTAEVVSVEPCTSLQEFSKLLEESNVSVMPVVDEDQSLYGIISATDLIESDRPLHIPTVISLFDWVLYLESEKNFSAQVKKICAQTVGDLCTRDVVVCAPETPVSEVAELMVKHKVHLVPVVQDGKLAGVVGRHDILRSMGNITGDKG